jgi:hypothetical protein
LERQTSHIFFHIWTLEKKDMEIEGRLLWKRKEIKEKGREGKRE